MKIAPTFKIALLAAFFSASALQAQTRPGLSPERKQELVNLSQESKERLKLTPEQDPKFDEISTRYFQEFRAIKTGNDGVTEKFNKVRDSQIRKDAEMQKLLTPDQYQLYLQIQQERRDRMQGKR
jgi:Spy/CpxP family protein refolding chaperone